MMPTILNYINEYYHPILHWTNATLFFINFTIIDVSNSRFVIIWSQLSRNIISHNVCEKQRDIIHKIVMH